MNMQTISAGVNKELWEYNKVFFWLPILLASFVILMPVLQLGRFEDYQWQRILQALTDLSQVRFEQGEGMLVKPVFGGISLVFAPFIGISMMVQIYYFSACLYDERKDMSVYFWRSLPVADSVTIGTKLITGALVIPAIFMAAATVALLVFSLAGLAAIVFFNSSYGISLWHVWENVELISNLGKIWLSLLPYFFWLLPVFAWFMLASAFANKAPFLWAVVPVASVMLIEVTLVEYFNLNSYFIVPVLADYFDISDALVKGKLAEISDITWLPLAVLAEKVSIVGILFAVVALYATHWLRVNKS